MNIKENSQRVELQSSKYTHLKRHDLQRKMRLTASLLLDDEDEATIETNDREELELFLGTLQAEEQACEEREPATRLKRHKRRHWRHYRYIRQKRSGSSCEATSNADAASQPLAAEVRHPKLFFCPEPACKKTYTSARRLENHLTLGNHIFQPDKESMLDRSLRMYGTFIEHRGLSSLPLYGPDGNIDIVQEESEHPPEEMGWALFLPAKSSRFNQEQRTFLEGLYWEGEQSKQAERGGEDLSRDEEVRAAAAESADPEPAPGEEYLELDREEELYQDEVLLALEASAVAQEEGPPSTPNPHHA